jgi:hypothetical protein
MKLAGIVAVSGKPGLFNLIGQNKSGYILESLDDSKTKTIVSISTAKLASLEDITVFGENEDLKLKDIFEVMKSSGNIPDPKDDGKILRAFFVEVAPEHDQEKVYASDMKKIISWFLILKDLPLFSEVDETTEDSKEEGKVVKEASKAIKNKTAKPKSDKAGNTKSVATKKAGGKKNP